MAALAELIQRPPPTADPTLKLRIRSAGIAVGLAGVAFVVATLVVNVLVARGDAGADNLLWTFGLATAGFGTVKLGIALVLMGIVVRLWMRVDAVKWSLPRLRPDTKPDSGVEYGTSTHLSARQPKRRRPRASCPRRRWPASCGSRRS